MRVLIQRVTHAAVRIDGRVVGGIGPGLLALVGIGHGDAEADLVWMAKKVATLRVFADSDGKMNLSVLEIGGGILAVSQFTLYGDARKGRRPSFVEACEPSRAAELHERFVALLGEQGVDPVATGVFGADMQIELENDGPVTLMIESPAERHEERVPGGGANAE